MEGEYNNYLEKIEDTISILHSIKLGLSRSEREYLDFAADVCEQYIEEHKDKLKNKERCPHASKCYTFGYGCDGVSYIFCDKPKKVVDDTKGLIRRE